MDNLLIGRFHLNCEWLLVHLRVIVVIQETTPHLRVVPLQIRLNLLITRLGEDGRMQWLVLVREGRVEVMLHILFMINYLFNY